MHVHKNLGSAALFVCIGLGAVIISLLNYDIGSMRRMGPGFFPLAVGAMLALLGLVLLGQSLRLATDDWVGRCNLRVVLPLMSGILAFGLLIRPYGLVAATSAMTCIAAFAVRDVRPWELLAIIALQCVLAVGIFVMALGMPISVWG